MILLYLMSSRQIFYVIITTCKASGRVVTYQMVVVRCLTKSRLLLIELRLRVGESMLEDSRESNYE